VTHPNTHVMLDLETLSTAKDAAILQIAARVFDPEDGVCGPEFNAFIRHPGGHVDVDTVLWWMQQAQAGHLAKACSSAAFSELDTLKGFANWLSEVNPSGAVEPRGHVRYRGAGVCV
jgi:hypothetical protein